MIPARMPGRVWNRREARHPAYSPKPRGSAATLRRAVAFNGQDLTDTRLAEYLAELHQDGLAPASITQAAAAGPQDGRLAYLVSRRAGMDTDSRCPDRQAARLGNRQHHRGTDRGSALPRQPATARPKPPVLRLFARPDVGGRPLKLELRALARSGPGRTPGPRLSGVPSSAFNVSELRLGTAQVVKDLQAWIAGGVGKMGRCHSSPQCHNSNFGRFCR